MDDKALAMQSVLDQWATNADNIGSVMAGYYARLIAESVPAEVAGRMARDWHWLMWHRLMYDNESPRVMPQ